MRTPGAILVAETDHAVADLIAEILRDDGYAVSERRTRSHRDARVDRQTAARTHPARQPHREPEHRRLARTHQPAASGSIPIITTTSPALATILTGRDSWACLAKPFSLDALVAHVTHYVPLT